jgi:undecaprenyl-diphosphatase
VLVFTQIISTTGFLLVSGGMCTYFLVRKNYTQARALFVSAWLAILSTELLKNIFHTPRPSGALIATTGYAFPSGHAMGSLFLALVVAHLARNQQPRIRYALYAACLLFPLAVGLSRLGFGVHTLLQVCAGYVVGALWAGVFILLSQRARPHVTKKGR